MFPSDSVFEDDGVETPPTATQQTEEEEQRGGDMNAADQEEESWSNLRGTGTGLSHPLLFHFLSISFKEALKWSSGEEAPAPAPPEPAEVPPSTSRTEGQQMNGFIEDRSSVSSTDMLVSTAPFSYITVQKEDPPPPPPPHHVGFGRSVGRRREGCR